MLIDCVNNFLRWSGATVAQALKAVTTTPAAMLGVQGVKGCLDPGADADLVVLSEQTTTTPTCDADDGGGARRRRSDPRLLVVDEVWKFGERIF